MKPLILCMSALLLISCGSVSSDDHAAQQVAVNWANAYFNCDYFEAKQYVTEESKNWLNFAASNTTEADLQVLNHQHAEAESNNDFPVANDTLRVVSLTVTDFLASTDLGDAPRQQEEGTFWITVVKRDDNWYVKMEGLPRSEKQSHDSALDE